MTGPVRVLWLVKGLGPGGAERLLLTHARCRDRERFDYRAAYLVPWKDQLVPELAAEGVPAECLDGGRWWDPSWLVRLRRLMRTADVVHSHSPLPASVARLLRLTLRRARRPRLVYTEHNEWGKHRRPTRWLNRLTLALEDRVVAVSDGVRRSMGGRDDVEVVHHWIDAEGVRADADRDGARAELGFGPGDLVVGTVANLRWEKGYDLLLDAAAEVVRTRPDVTFVSVGQGPLEAELSARRDQLSLGDRFRFLGYREDAIRVMSAFDWFCLASRHEGLPVALMEAMALGLPAVATEVGGVGELAQEPGCSLELVRPGSAGSIARALLAVDRRSDRDGAPTWAVHWPAGYEEAYRTLHRSGG